MKTTHLNQSAYCFNKKLISH